MRYTLRLAVLLLAVPSAHAAEPARPGPVGGDSLDKAAFAHWVEGTESPIPEDDAKGGPSALVWGKRGRPEWRGVTFAPGRTAGPRCLRIGFTKPVAVGSVLVRGGGVLSVLKPDAAYPGDLGDDSQWLAAQRLVGREVSGKEAGRENYALWVLPAGTTTRAFRFTHTPGAGDREMAGWLGGVWICPQRMANVAPQALAQSVARDDVSAKLVDESNNRTWKTWDNGEQGAAVRISPEHPEIVTLIWPREVELRGLCLLWTGFSAVDVDAFTGRPGENIRQAPETSWRQVAQRRDMDALYPMALGPNWVSFERAVRTRALRLRITAGAKSGHPHLRNKVRQGRRVWLGEVMALAPLADDAALAGLVLPAARTEPPPIPIRFTVRQAGLVTLVIEDAKGHRVRNLISEMPLPAGENVVWWDGSDDLLRDPQAARHGVYHIPTRLVAPGAYTVRGLWHKPLKLCYQFSIYNAGKPPWRTADNTGCWLTTHTPPTSVAVVPGSRTEDGKPLIFLGAYVAEGGHGLQWLGEDYVKRGGQHWVGGTWTGAPTLAVDLGEHAVRDHLCYVGSLWDGEFRLTAKTRALRDAPVLKEKLGEDPRIRDNDPHAARRPPRLEGFEGGEKVYVLGGIAARDGKVVCSLVRQSQLLVVDVAQGKITSRITVENPRGMAFDSQGRLLVLSRSQLLRLDTLSGEPQTIISRGLEDPRHVAVDAEGRILISDRGDSHQVKVFSPEGKLLRAIGTPGAPAIGPYDPRHMNNPSHVAVDTRGRIWVAEASNHPRRVSVWSADGKLLRAFYGPTEYGGGGVLDPQDPTRFYYKGMEFRLDWKTRTDTLARLFHLPRPLLSAHYGPYSPDTPLYPSAAKGRRYFTSCYTHTPTHGDDVAFVWLDEPKCARLVAAVGNAHSWRVLRGGAFRGHWPEGTHPEKDRPKERERAAFAWTDANGDGRPQPGEVQFVKAFCRGVTVMNDLSVVVARYGERSVRVPAVCDKSGLPRYDLEGPKDLGPAGGRSPSSGGNQALADPGGWTVYTNAPPPLSPYGLGGSWQGTPRWSYPSAWPGLHASHESAVPDRPGMVVGHTRLLGGWVRGKAGPMFFVNGNQGNMYLLTADGLFVATLFHDIRLRPNWAAPVATPDMDVTDVSLHDENFWPSITQTADGRVFLVDGARTSLVRVDGLDTLTRLDEQKITVTARDLERARDWFARRETRRQQRLGRRILRVPLRKTAPRVDGKLDDWPATTDWAPIDRRGTKAYFNSNSRPYDVRAAVALTPTHLYAAWRTTEKDLLRNSGQTPNAPFLHGGCLDVMLATDASAAPGRASPVRGDQRLLVTRVKGRALALLYRAKVPGTKDPVAFSSPWRTVHIDVVEDVTKHVAFATDKAGNFEIGIPLAVLGWRPEAGRSYRGDLGVLRGAGGQTTQRVYWSNKSTAITADVPSEAALMPKLWGTWRVVAD